MKNELNIIIRIIAFGFKYILTFNRWLSENYYCNRRLFPIYIELRIYIFYIILGRQIMITLLSSKYIDQARAPPLLKL